MASGNPKIAEAGAKTRFKKGQSGNPAGLPKGTKHLSTYIQELMEDEEFEATIQQGLRIVEYKGMPIKAIIMAQMTKAINGDTKAFDSLGKYGWSQKIEQENTGEQTLTIKHVRG